MNIYVGNIPKEVVESDLQKLFTTFGSVSRVKIIRDSFTGESKGYGFIEMPGQTEAKKALTELNSYEIKGKKLTVNEARPRPGMKSNKPGNRDNGFNNDRNW